MDEGRGTSFGTEGHVISLLQVAPRPEGQNHRSWWTIDTTRSAIGMRLAVLLLVACFSAGVLGAFDVTLQSAPVGKGEKMLRDVTLEPRASTGHREAFWGVCAVV